MLGINSDELPWISEYFRRTNTIRTDLVAVGAFAQERLSGSAGDEVKLFWDIWSPKALSLATAPVDWIGEKAPPLPDDVEETLLEELAMLEHSEHERVAFKPDASDTIDISDAIRYVHVATAMALRLQARDDYSK